MTIAHLIDHARKRYAAHRRYRKAMAEIHAMSNSELHEIGAFQIDMINAARRELAEG